MLKLTIGAAAALLGAGAAIAAPTVYTAESSFNAATSGQPFTLESFESVRSGSNSYDFGPVTASCVNCALSTSDRYASSGRNALSFSAGSPGGLTFTFDETIAAVSFDLFGFGSLAPGDLFLTVNGVTVQLLDDYSGPDGNVRFFGFTDATPFTSFSLTGGTSGDTSYIDRLRFAAGGRVIDPPPAVPEPATWAMMIGGFALVGRSLRTSRRGAGTVAA